ncbi:hypothetical protein PoB_007383800 [Plakobranchus ocellatus]|uniref:Uncharacterized protein n=1 Tax=Plakobranchus ocellatus TaxID=259542 RepID=A0AAV4DT92_9GAST|nr:hypothetical protein PoB_007383800 [Plakobranchus ocellatus]
MLLLLTFFIGMLFAVAFLLLKTDSWRSGRLGVDALSGLWHWLRKMAYSSGEKQVPVKEGGLSGAGNFSFKDFMEKDSAEGALYFSMEKAQALTTSLSVVDKVYFGGTDKSGCNIVCCVSRRCARQADVWLFVQVPGIGCLQYPRHPDVDVHYTDGLSFTAGGLTCEVLEPMRAWKISFSGKLRRGLCNSFTTKPKEFVETSFSFIWRAFSQPYNLNTDLNLSILSDNGARERQTSKISSDCLKNPVHTALYQQWGELRGRLSVEGFEEHQLYLQCMRERLFGKRDWSTFHHYITHSIYFETGMCVQVGVFSLTKSHQHAKMGYLSYPNGDLVSVKDIDIDLWDVGGGENEEPPVSWGFSFHADGQSYTVRASSQGAAPVWYHGEDRAAQVVEVFTNFSMNGIAGHGISEFFYRNLRGPPVQNILEDCLPVPEASADAVRSMEREITLSFSDVTCTSSSLVGGKGAQLAQLTQIEEHVHAKVPPGFCLTLWSFQLQLEAHKNIGDAIDRISTASV